MNTFSEIISLWPSAEELARDVGATGLVVRAWRARRSIPSEYWVAVIGAAERRGIPHITLELFAKLAASRGKRAQGEGERAVQP